MSDGLWHLLAPQLLHHTADLSVVAIQQQATTVTFCLIVAGQMGTLLACRSDRRPAWALLGLPNPLLWLGWISEPLLASALVLVILVDALDKRWRHPGQLPPRFSRSLAAVPR